MLTAAKSTSLLLRGLLLEKRVDGGLRVRENQALLDGAGFTLLARRLGHFGHGLVVLSSGFLVAGEMVPQPGFGPGRRESRDWKARLSAISSTGG